MTTIFFSDILVEQGTEGSAYFGFWEQFGLKSALGVVPCVVYMI